MNLYEVVDGSIGCSYVRVYAWAPNEETAIMMASNKTVKGKYPFIPTSCTLLFTEDSEPFSTEPDDEGWRVDSVIATVR